MPGDELHRENAPAGARTEPTGVPPRRSGGGNGPRHAAPKKPLLTRLHVPAGKAIALAAMPTAVLMGMGLTPQLANAKPMPPESPFRDGPCVTAPDTADGQGGKTGGQDGKAKDGKAKDGAKDKPDPSPSPSAGTDPGKDSGDGKETAPAPSGSGKPGEKPGEPSGTPTPSPPPSPSTSPGDEKSPDEKKEDGGLLGGIRDVLGGLLGGDSAKEPTADAPSTSPSPSASSSVSPSTSPSPSATRNTTPAGKAPGTGSGDAADKVTKPVGDAVKNPSKTVEDTVHGAVGAADNALPGGGLDGKDADGKRAFPCVVENKQKGKDEQTPAALPDAPWHLESSALTLRGLNYEGVVNVTTHSGHTKQALKFTADSVDIGDLHQIIDDPASGKKYHVRAAQGSTSTIRGGKVTLYSERLQGNLFGLIPIVFDPEHPPPLNVPFAYFTKVKLDQAGQFGGTLHVPGMHVTIEN
ncbi:hypothetical protein ACFY12_01365 [Streptomyces sp. NPDC001339]|uniref:hypothetical protein n=1 Tax=Streptomyces sp. NPDC001339 TaxID=3364563 RepID=UPI0036CED701